MRHLWQRIFAYSLLLFLLSQVTVLLLHRYSISSEEMERFIRGNTAEMAAALEGQSLETADGVARVFNRRRDRLWIERADGSLAAGKRPAAWRGFEPGGDSVYRLRYQDEETGLRIWNNSAQPDSYVATLPVRLTAETEESRFYMAFNPPRRPSFWGRFLQGLVVLSLIGVLLALWMAWRVSRPLRQLRRELLGIAEGALDRRVTVRGADEIGDVAQAVNHMADSLSRNVRSMRELVANVSHELRSPLARMQISLTLLEESLPPAQSDNRASQRAHAKVLLLREELAHMDRLIGDTLLTSRLDLQDHPPMTQTVDFSALCAEMLRRHEPVLAQRGLCLGRALEPDLSFPGDEALLCNLVSNLLDNAAKYAPENSQVDVRLIRQGHAVLLEVENNHAPLPDDTLERIFQPFNRAGIATGNGVGLGLSLVRRIAALHHAKASARNTAGGVCFSVRFEV